MNIPVADKLLNKSTKNTWESIRFITQIKLIFPPWSFPAILLQAAKKHGEEVKGA